MAMWKKPYRRFFGDGQAYQSPWRYTLVDILKWLAFPEVRR